MKIKRFVERVDSPEEHWKCGLSKHARLIISEIMLDVFNGLKMTFPTPTAERLRERQAIRKTLGK